ncbi:MAG: glycosyltransferase family 4 protein [Actinobacteria bacterium]|nr:glycosyltransferase family 4 protein [Actinomycetota bacterium]
MNKEKKGLNICVLARVMPAHAKGGMQDHTLSLCEELVESGHKVTVITTQHPDGLEYENLNGVEVFYLRETEPIKYSSSWQKESVRKFIELNDKLNFEIVHGQGSGGLPFLIQKVNLKHKIPTVISFHGTTYDEIRSIYNVMTASGDLKTMAGSLKGILWHLQHYASIFQPVRRAEGVIATSNEQRDILKRMYQLPDDKLYLVYNGIDVNLFKPMIKDRTKLSEYNLNEDDYVLFAVARMVEEKGIQNLIKAMPLIISQTPNLKLILAGDGDYRFELERLADELNLKEKIIFTGSVSLEELPYFYSNCDIFINPTIRANGYDLTILQAMASGKAVIVSDIGSIPTVINNNENGVLVQPGNVEEIAKSVVDLLSRPDFREQIGKMARERIVEKFSLESMTEGTIKVYRDVLERYK